MSGTTGVEKLDHPGQKVHIPDANYDVTWHMAGRDESRPIQRLYNGLVLSRRREANRERRMDHVT